MGIFKKKERLETRTISGQELIQILGYYARCMRQAVDMNSYTAETAALVEYHGQPYEDGDWRYWGSGEEVMVLHTLAVSPNVARKGVGSGFVKFYEEYAREQGCSVLRMDTNEQNIIWYC